VGGRATNTIGRVVAPPTFPAGAARLAVAAAIATMALKFGAWGLTGSVGLLSDAVESSVNLVAALAALSALRIAARPADRSHNYGHGKVEFFASGVEGTLVLLAAAATIWYAAGRLVEPRALEAFGVGTGIALLATAVNLGVARLLLRVAREHGSVALEADGRHLMTDVWTSLGVVAGLGLVALTGIQRLDPLIALLVGANIARTGIDLLRGSVDGLMDRALSPEAEGDARRAIEARLAAVAPGTTYHALRTRRAGSRRFVDLHLLVPGQTTVRRAHDLADELERAVDAALPGAETVVHVEPIEEPAAYASAPAWEDGGNDRMPSDERPVARRVG